MHPALLYKKLKGNVIECLLCAQRCLIRPGGRGLCGVRQNTGGELYTLTYGRLIHAHSDLIENKGLYHFLPGTKAFSIATPGCNFSCEFCQNADQSQLNKEADADTDILEKIAGLSDEATPEAVVTAAQQLGCRSLAYTYTEPTIFFEFVLDTAKLAQEKGLKNILVTNGYLTTAARKLLAPVVDAISLDLKAFTKDFYKKYCGAELDPVLENIQGWHHAKKWLEVTTLIIPKVNNSEKELRRLTQFIAKLDRSIPWRIIRFRGAFRMVGHPNASDEDLIQAAEIGKEAGLKYVYILDLPETQFAHTLCPKCGEMVVERHPPAVTVKLGKGGRCPNCKTAVKGAFN